MVFFAVDPGKWWRGKFLSVCYPGPNAEMHGFWDPSQIPYVRASLTHIPYVRVSLIRIPWIPYGR